jgi:hypothetical protein
MKQSLILIILLIINNSQAQITKIEIKNEQLVHNKFIGYYKEDKKYYPNELIFDNNGKVKILGEIKDYYVLNDTIHILGNYQYVFKIVGNQLNRVSPYYNEIYKKKDKKIIDNRKDNTKANQYARLLYKYDQLSTAFLPKINAADYEPVRYQKEKNNYYLNLKQLFAEGLNYAGVQLINMKFLDFCSDAYFQKKMEEKEKDDSVKIVLSDEILNLSKELIKRNDGIGYYFLAASSDMQNNEVEAKKYLKMGATLGDENCKDRLKSLK